MPTSIRIARTLLDLGFAELNVLLGDRIVFLLYHFLGLGARILLGDVEIAGIGARQELDLDHGRLGHWGGPRLRRVRSLSCAEPSGRGQEGQGIALIHNVVIAREANLTLPPISLLRRTNSLRRPKKFPACP